MATSSTPTLNCANCGYVNEAERVYCHNCGTKLDRSLLPKGAVGKSESPDKARRRVKRMTNPSKGSVVRELKTLMSVLIWAAIVAALILIVLPPEEIPGKPEPADRLVSSDLQMAFERPQPIKVTFSENDINSHLGSIRSKTKGWVPGLDFKRAFVQLEPGVVRISMEQSAWGYSLYSSIDEQIGVTGSEFWSKQAGGHFGRLAIHPAIMEYADVAFGRLWTALARDKKQMDRMQSITVEKGRIVLITQPGQAP